MKGSKPFAEVCAPANTLLLRRTTRFRLMRRADVMSCSIYFVTVSPTKSFHSYPKVVGHMITEIWYKASVSNITCLATSLTDLYRGTGWKRCGDSVKSSGSFVVMWTPAGWILQYDDYADGCMSVRGCCMCRWVTGRFIIHLCLRFPPPQTSQQVIS